MKRLLFVFIWTGFTLSAQEPSGSTKRDPFWPIGYDPAKTAVQETREAVGNERALSKPEAPPPLSEEELRQLALEETERIRQELQRKGTMIAGDRIFAYLQDKWVSTGDTLSIEVDGNTYRLEILNLTRDNIELEAHPTNR